jgi:di/tricarboxylate transporter
MINSNSAKTKFRGLYTLASLMDNRFRIPGTNIHFGFDALIGLIPGIGDLISFLISAYIISEATRYGASGYVRSRMILNVAIDTIIGSIPVLGDIFDVGFKANQKNMRLLEQHFNEGKHKGSANKVLIPVGIVLIALFAFLIWLCYKAIVWIF